MNHFVSVIIVNYRSKHLLPACLVSVRDAMETSYEIVLVNNDADENLSAFEVQFQNIRIIQNQENAGFAKAVNQGIRVSSGSHILLLNPDARLVKNSVSAMLRVLDASQDIAVVGPMLLDERGALHSQSSITGRFPSPLLTILEYTVLRRLFGNSSIFKSYTLSDWDRRLGREVAMAQGACLLIRKRALDEIGLLDERFFLYFEETDFCLRAKQKGWKIYYLPSAECIHIGGASIGNSEPTYPQDSFQFFKSLLLFHQKHYGLFQTFLVRVVMLLSFLMEWTVRELFGFWARNGELNRHHCRKRLMPAIKALLTP